MLRISSKVNFTPNTLGCYGLRSHIEALVQLIKIGYWQVKQWNDRAQWDF